MCNECFECKRCKCNVTTSSVMDSQVNCNAISFFAKSNFSHNLVSQFFSQPNDIASYLRHRSFFESMQLSQSSNNAATTQQHVKKKTILFLFCFFLKKINIK